MKNTTKPRYLKFDKKLVPIVKGQNTSCFPQEKFPRIKGIDDNGKPCILIDCSFLIVVDK